MTIYIPPVVIWIALAAVWCVGVFGSLFARSADGADRGERLVVSLVIAGLWPVRALLVVLAALWRRS